MKQNKSNRRSRSKGGGKRGNNQNRGGGGKNRNQVRQMLDKFNSQGREAMQSGDRIAAEGFFQHAEHYQRLMNEFGAEENARNEARQKNQAENQKQDQNQDQKQPQANSESAVDAASSEDGVVEAKPNEDTEQVASGESVGEGEEKPAKPRNPRRKRVAAAE